MSLKEFDESCKSLLKKAREFEANYYCKKCKKTGGCPHLHSAMNRKFKKEIDENTRLVCGLAKETFSKVEKVRKRE